MFWVGFLEFAYKFRPDDDKLIFLFDAFCEYFFAYVSDSSTQTKIKK